MAWAQLGDETRAVITNRDAVRIDQTSKNNHEVRFLCATRLHETLWEVPTM